MALPKVTKKKTVRLPRRVLTGAAAAPTDSFGKCKEYFHFEVDNKETSNLVKEYIKKEFSKDDAKAILANPEYNFHMFSHWAATIFWLNQGLEWEERYFPYRDKVRAHYENLIEPGKKILKEKVEVVEDKSATVIRLTPQQLLWQKVAKTVMVDIDELEDQWIDGQTTTIDLYQLFKKHDLKPAAVPQVRSTLEGWYNDYFDSYNKKCEQAVEGYSHIKRTEQKRRLDAIKAMLADLDRIVQAGKATRKTRAPKPRTADKQIAQLKYKKEDTELKIVSINPTQIIGAMRLIVINAKYRTVTEYISQRTNGFEIKGTTLVGFDEEKSRTKTMRKPQDFIPICSKTIRQFDKAFTALSTKEVKPTGRINTDCVLVKVDK